VRDEIDASTAGPALALGGRNTTDELESPARWLALDRSLVILDGSRPGGDDRLAPGLDAAAGPRAVRRGGGHRRLGPVRLQHMHQLPRTLRRIPRTVLVCVHLVSTRASEPPGQSWT